MALGADDRGPLTDTLLAELARRDVAVETFGALRDGSTQWASMARSVAEEVASARADLGIVCCWTGTGVSIAANKVAGVRAALCGDAATAAGSRRWNDANVLALSLRATSPALACEILAAFLDTPASDDPDDRREIAKLSPP